MKKIRKKKKEKKRRNPEQTEQPTQEKKKIEQTELVKKKKSQRSKVAVEYCLWVPYVYLITILLLSYELWKLKTAKMCFQFP